MDHFLRKAMVLVGVLIVVLVVPGTVAATPSSTGQTVYLPVIPQTQTKGSRVRTHHLELLMTIRNTDLNRSVVIRSIAYHNAEGKLAKTILTSSLTLPPLASHAIRFEKGDLVIPAGMSSCMIVEWDAAEAVSPVLVDGVVIGTGTGWTAGLTFTGIVIREK